MKFAITATPNPVKFAPIVFCGPVEAAFRKAALLEYNGVEIHLRDPDDISRSGVAGLKNDTGLEVTTLGTGIASFEYGIHFAHPEESVRRQAVAHVEKFVGLAAELGSCVTIGMFNGTVGRGEDREERRKAAIGNIAQCAATAKKEDVQILLEPLNRYENDYINTVADAVTIIEEIGLSNIKVLADTFHMNIEEIDIAHTLRENIQYLGYVHLVDSNRQMPGKGHTPIPGIIDALIDGGYSGYLSFECLPVPSAETVANDAIAYIRSLVEP